ncbi:MAG: MraY family glycosyltransferase [Ktedonobacteraceae bacterium]
MVQASIISLRLWLIVPLHFSNVALLVIGPVAAFLLVYVLTFGVRAFCFKMGWLDYPEARRIHTRPTPRLGGVGIFLGFVLASLLFYSPGSNNEVIIYWLLIAAGALMVLVHMIDDIFGLSPLIKIIAQSVAVIIMLGPWDGLFYGVLLFGFNNPFGVTAINASTPWYQQPTIFLFIHPLSPLAHVVITVAAIPAVLLTWFWIVGMMNTVNWIDGMDGLATGVVAIAGLFITLISVLLKQDSIAILSAIFTGATLGFLPHNWNPAKIFMGDTGSMFLGLGLAVLSIMGGAKLASALMVLGIPIMDVAVVIINRIRRGQRPWHFDKSHLQNRLLATGLSVRQICYLLYGFSLVFGFLAFLLSGVGVGGHFYKLIGIGVVALAMTGLIIWIDYRHRQRGVRIELGGPNGGNDGNSESEPAHSEVSDTAVTDVSPTTAIPDLETHEEQDTNAVMQGM